MSVITNKWNDGSGDSINIESPSFQGNQTVKISSPVQKGTSKRSMKFIGKCKKDSSKQVILTVEQEASTYTYDLTLNSDNTEIAAKGGTATITAVLKTYRNGNLVSTDNVTPVLSGSATGFSISGTTVTASNRTTVAGAERSITVTGKYSGTYDGQEVSATVVVKQEANYIESLKIGGGSTTQYLPATITYSAAGGSNPFTGWGVYTSGSKLCITTFASGDWVLSQSYFSKTLSNGIVTVTGEYRGTTVGSSRTGTLTVNLKSAATENKQLSTSVTLTQAENTKAYGNISILDFHYSVASGDSTTSTPVVEATQATSYSSGAKSSEQITGSRRFVISGTIPSYVSIDSSTGVLTWQANTSGSTRSVIVSLTITANGHDANNNYNASQSTGVKTYSNVTVSLKYSQIPAKGGTVTPTISYSQTWGWNGATTGGGTITTGGTVTYSGATSSNGSVTADSKKAILSGVTNVATVTAKVSLNGKEGTATYTVQQAENKYISVEIRHIHDYSSPRLFYEAKGGSDAYTALFTTTSGTSGIETTLVPYSAWSISSTDGFTMSLGSTGNYWVNVQVASRGTTLGDARTSILKITYQGVSAQITLTQDANVKTDITYGNIYITYFIYPDIPASGGSVNPKLAYTQAKIQNYSSGDSKNIYTISSGATLTYGKSGTAGGGSINATTGVVSVGTRGTAVGNRWEIGEFFVIIKLNGKEVTSPHVICYQEANEASYGALIDGSVLASDIPASGGTSSTDVINMLQIISYTSGSTRAGTVTYSKTSEITVSSLGTTVKARTKVGQVTVTYTGEGGATANKTVDIYQSENKVTNSNYNPRITAYGTPTVSIGSGLTAAGGSAKVSASVTNTETYNALYSSGATGPNQTRSIGGSLSISMTANGNSRFSLSGNTITHSSMGTNETTDTITIKAVNNGDNSKSATASKSIVNSKTVKSASGGVYTYGNITAGTITNATIPASGGSATAKAGNGTQSWNKSATITTYQYDSGSTKDVTTENASSGTNNVSPSIASIKATASSKGTIVSSQTTVKSQVVTWSANGKSASGTMYIYQAANAIDSYNYGSWNIAISANPTTIAASGGTSTITASCTRTKTPVYTSGSTGTATTESATPTLAISGTGFTLSGTTVTASKNNVAARTATVTASYSGATSKSVTITQSAGPDGIGYMQIEGNGVDHYIFQVGRTPNTRSNDVQTLSEEPAEVATEAKSESLFAKIKRIVTNLN